MRKLLHKTKCKENKILSKVYEISGIKKLFIMDFYWTVNVSIVYFWARGGCLPFHTWSPSLSGWFIREGRRQRPSSLSPLVPADQEGIRLEPFDSAVAWSYLEAGVHSIIHGSAHTAHHGHTPSFSVRKTISSSLSRPSSLLTLPKTAEQLCSKIKVGFLKFYSFQQSSNYQKIFSRLFSYCWTVPMTTKFLSPRFCSPKSP